MRRDVVSALLLRIEILPIDIDFVISLSSHLKTAA